MGFWQRIKDRLGGAGDQGEAEPTGTGAGRPSRPGAALERRDEPPSPGDAATRPAPADELAELARVGLESGPSIDEAIAVLRRARGTVREAEAVEAALRGMGERRVPDPVRVACAEILAARGDDEQALRLLEGASLTAGLVLAADLYAAGGQLPRAVGTIERVLARDITAPGALERHARWRAALGRAAAPVKRLDEATVVTASPSRGPFRLLREVARGGAGAVYEAEDELLGRRIAFKVYHGRGADRPLVLREARLAAALAGPGVLRIFDASPDDGWVALEWVGRGSVRDLLRAGHVASLLPMVRWVGPLARALARVHAAGYVHADVKPANVLLRQPNDAVLGDFGIARRMGNAGEAGEGGGSAGYVSPERLAGRSADPRDDVYGFGRILEDVLHRADASGLAAAEDDPFRALALRCIGTDAERPADGRELLDALP